MGRKKMHVEPYGPTARPDAAMPHQNPIRRFREELRLTRQEFADLIGENIESLRVWETPGASKPRPDRARKIIEVAERNHYPLTLTDIYPDHTD